MVRMEKSEIYKYKMVKIMGMEESDVKVVVILVMEEGNMEW